MGIAENFTNRQANGIKPGKFAYSLVGDRVGERVLIVSQHPTFSEAAGEPVYTVQYDDGAGGKLLLSEIAKTPPEPLQQDLFSQAQLKPKIGDKVILSEDHEVAGQTGTIIGIHPASGEVIVDVGDSWSSYIAYRDEYQIIGDDGIYYSPPEIRDEDDLVLE